MLDLIHEDVNKIHNKPYVQFPDSNGRPDAEVCKEFWDLYIKRNTSVINDLFGGQFKSMKKCTRCGYSNTSFGT